MIYTYQAYTCAGKRPSNEDDFYPRNHGEQSNFFIVSDGVGGHGDGELASKFVVDELAEELHKIQELGSSEPLKILAEVNYRLKLRAQEIGNPKMGSTVAFLVGERQQALVGWVGDSRIYHFRKGELLFRSKDHTLVELLFENGDLTQEQYANYPMKHIIWQAMGSQMKELQPGLELLSDVKPGDHFLLATDGLTEVWPEHDLLSVFSKSKETIAEELITRCHKHATDNFTFMLVEVQAPFA